MISPKISLGFLVWYDDKAVGVLGWFICESQSTAPDPYSSLLLLHHFQSVFHSLVHVFNFVFHLNR